MIYSTIKEKPRSCCVLIIISSFQLPWRCLLDAA